MSQENGKLILDPIEIGDDATQVFIFRVYGTEDPIPQANKTYDFIIALDPRNLNSVCADFYTRFTVPSGDKADEGVVAIHIPKDVTSTFKQAVYNFKLRRILNDGEDEQERIVTYFDGTISFEY